MRETHDVTIVGGGVIGLAVAHRLCAEGRQVTVVEAGERLGTGASSSAMGGIIAETDESCFTSLGEITRYSRTIYPAWLREISAASGISIPLLESGAIQVALDTVEMLRLETQLLPRWRAMGSDVAPLGKARLLESEPLLSDTALGGFLLPSEPALEPATLLCSLTGALRLDHRASVKANSHVVEVTSGPHGAAVVLDNGIRIGSETVVIAGGHLSGRLVPQVAGVLFPVKGEALEVRVPDVGTYPLRHHIYALVDLGGLRRPAYVVPRMDGRLTVGVTHDVGVSTPLPTAGNLAVIRRGLAALIPSAARWPVIRHWAGIRPGSTDYIPLIGPVDEHDRVILATGHHGLGVTLAPATAHMVSALLGGQMREDVRRHLAVCDPARFVRADLSPDRRR